MNSPEFLQMSFKNFIWWYQLSQTNILEENFSENYEVSKDLRKLVMQKVIV